ncbi:MAG: prephenate dehydratase [Verrucomicrobia bacterium]|nr:prephenate dehydratase [Verrucomicrobiota bacterium]
MKLASLRRKVDRLDDQMVRLLAERTRIAREIGRLKRQDGFSILAPGREASLLRRLEAKAGRRLDRQSLHAIYREILSSAREAQGGVRIAYLGPESSYCHQAARSRFGSSAHLVPCATIAEIFSAVDRGEVDAGVVPAENSGEGSVGATQDALLDTCAWIAGEIYLPVRHALLSRNATGPIRVVYSHPQALAQCRHWLATHHPEARLVEVASTAAGAKRAAKESGAAALASPLAATIYRLKIRQRDVQDRVGNTTRFLVTSLVFSLPHRAGALHRALGIFSARKLNLLKVESRPAPGKPWEYVFFVDVRGHADRPEFQRALAALRKQTQDLRVLGSYPEER